MAEAERKKIVLGEEYDAALRERATAILKELGGQVRGRAWGVGGSQELETLEVDVDGTIVVLEAETYVGLSISGDAEIVDVIASRVRLEVGKKLPALSADEVRDTLERVRR